MKYVRHTRIYHWQSPSCLMSLTFVCISSKQFVDVQHSIKREAFKTLKRKRRNSMMFVSKMYLKYSFKVTVWCEMWTNVLACAGLCYTSCKHDYFSCISFSARIVCSRHDSRHGPKSDRKRILPTVLMHFPCQTRLSPVDNHSIMHLPLWLFLPFFSRFCISQGRTHNFFSPSSCYRARPLNGEPRGSDDTRTYEKKNFQSRLTPTKPTLLSLFAQHTLTASLNRV